MKKLVILVFLILAAEISAQGVGSIGVSDARSNSLGNSYTVTSRGVYAIHKNPANLALPSDETIQLATVFPLPNLNFAAGTDFMTLEDINYYFGGVTGPNGQTVGRLLTDADKRNLVSLFDDGSRMRGSVNLNLFSLSVNAGEDIGSFAFSIGDRISVSADIPKGLVEFAMFGNETGVEYQFNDLNARSWYLRDYSLSYARQINDLIPALDIGDYIESLTVGVTLKMVQGLAYTNMDRIDLSFETRESDNAVLLNADMVYNIAMSEDFGIEWDFLDDNEVVEQNIGPFPTPAGSGFGFDLGISGQINDVWSFGFALTDIGSITWDQKVVAYTASGSYLVDDVAQDNLGDSIENALEYEGNYTDAFTSSLPSSMGLGVGFRLDRFLDGSFPGEMTIAAEYHQGFNDMPSNTTKPRFSLGMEWLPTSWLPIRTGFSFGGRENFRWGGGFGLDAGFLEFNFGTSYLHSIVGGNSVGRVGFSMGTRWKF